MNVINNLFKGTFLLTITMMTSKILGLIYIIPFTLLVGTSGYILYEYAYKPYAIILSLATMGIPAAVSKFVSKYNEIGDYATSRKLLKSGIFVMLFTGVFWFLVMQLTSGLIANALIGGSDNSGSSIEDVQFVIKTVSYALLIVPVMALFRGYFQGNQQMAPTGISQVLEQLVRIIFILITSYLIIKKGFLDGDIINAIGLATFAATLGAFSSFLLLLYYFVKFKDIFNEQKRVMELNEGKFEKVSLLTIYKEIIWNAIPFIIVSLSIPIYQNIDIVTLNRGLMSIGYSLKEAEYVNSVVAIANKLVNLPIVVANAFALTLVPYITKAFVGNNKETMQEQIKKSIQVILFINLPVAAAFFVLSQESYSVVFGTNDAILGGQMIKSYATTSIFFCLFTVTASILQGINKQYFTILSLIAGLIVKMLVALPFIEMFEGSGSAYSTIAGFSISIIINLYMIFKTVGVNPKFLISSTLKVIQYSLLALFVMLGAKLVLNKYELFDSMTYLGNLYTFLIVGVLGALVYVVPSYLTGDLKTMLSRKPKEV